jgi:hypothetical protein
MQYSLVSDGRYQELTDVQLKESLDYVQFELREMCDEERTPKWFTRRKGFENVAGLITNEQLRRKRQAEKLQKFGSLSLESQDPAQLGFW